MGKRDSLLSKLATIQIALLILAMLSVGFYSWLLTLVILFFAILLQLAICISLDGGFYD